MNKTRQEWSGQLKCSKDKHDDLTAFFATMAALFVVVAGFYGSVYFVGMRNAPFEVLDEREVTGAAAAAIGEPSTSSSAPTSSSGSSKPNKLIINDDDDSDDDLLIAINNESNDNSDKNLISLTETEDIGIVNNEDLF